MARVSAPTGYIPDVWDGSSDDFSHSQLAANWDAIDVNLTRLDSERMPLGTIVMWWRQANANPDIPWGSGTVWQPCDGRTISSANHDFPSGGNLVLPDMRNTLPIGAVSTDGGGSPAVTYPGDGVAAPQAGNSPNATYGPGVGGKQGSNKPLNMPNHYHAHPHIHQVGPSGNTPFDMGGPLDTATVSSGNAVTVATGSHHHNIKLFTSAARSPQAFNDNALIGHNTASDVEIDQTSLQKNPTNIGNPVQPTGGNVGDQIPIGGVNDSGGVADHREASMGVIFVMKVRNAP